MWPFRSLVRSTRPTRPVLLIEPKVEYLHNVMVRRDHIVKVLDFGLAKMTAPSSGTAIDSEAGTKVFVQTEPGLVMGTVSYMSPEQSMGKGIDQRTDIWSIGVVLYEMIAGCVPFQGKDIHRQIIAIQETEIGRAHV